MITENDITFKPAPKAIDRIFINRKQKYENVDNDPIVTETYLSNHYLLSLEIKLKKENCTKQLKRINQNFNKLASITHKIGCY